LLWSLGSVALKSEAHALLSWNAWDWLSAVNWLWLNVDDASAFSSLEALVSSASDELSSAVGAIVVGASAWHHWPLLVAAALLSVDAHGWISEWLWSWCRWWSLWPASWAVRVAFLSSALDVFAFAVVALMANALAWSEHLWNLLDASALEVLNDAHALSSNWAWNLVSELNWLDVDGALLVAGEALASVASHELFSFPAVMATSVSANAWLGGE
jgi:hypothetical protein